MDSKIEIQFMFLNWPGWSRDKTFPHAFVQRNKIHSAKCNTVNRPPNYNFILFLVKTLHTCYILNVKIGLWDGNSKFVAYQKIQVYEEVTGENICLLSLILQKNQVIQIEVCCFLSSKAQFYKHKPHSVW